MAQGDSPNRWAGPSAAWAVGRGIVQKLKRWPRDGVLRRVFKNAGLMLGAKSLAGLCGIAYLAVSARTLGPNWFGTVVLVHSYVLVVRGLTNFESWQAVIRYGAACLQENRRGDFQRLVKFTFLLDFGSSVVGLLAAVILAPVIGPWLGWNDDTVLLAGFYGVLNLFTISATPKGVLRLFNRFDLLAIQSAVTPVVRLLGVLVVYFGGGGFQAFLLVWLASGVAGRVTLIAMGWRELRRQGVLSGTDFSLRGLVKPHRGLWRFVWTSNFHTSLTLLTNERVVTLVVGAMLGPIGAGLYRIAMDISTVLAEPTRLLSQTVYPELAKLRAQDRPGEVGRLVLRIGLVGAGVGVVALVIVATLGEVILTGIFGDEFQSAFGVLLLLILARGIGMGGLGLDPLMYAVGRPDISLRANIVVTLFSLPLLLFLLAWMGLVGAGLAVVANALLLFVVMSVIAVRILSRHESGTGPPLR